MTKPAFISLAAVFAIFAGSAAAGPDPSMGTRNDRVVCLEGREQAAIAACTRFIHSGALTKEERADAFYQRARSWAAIGEYDSVIRDFDEIARRFPDHPGTFNARGLVYAQKEDYERAIADYDRAIALDPTYSAPLVNRGLAHYQSGQGSAPFAISIRQSV
jgi:lipoprotein NlpI